jgi:hypothetical protein
MHFVMFMIMFHCVNGILEICPDVKVMSFGSGSGPAGRNPSRVHDFHNGDIYIMCILSSWLTLFDIVIYM